MMHHGAYNHYNYYNKKEGHSHIGVPFSHTFSFGQTLFLFQTDNAEAIISCYSFMRLISMMMHHDVAMLCALIEELNNSQ
jgi:hypothetical protein